MDIYIDRRAQEAIEEALMLAKGDSDDDDIDMLINLLWG